MRRPMLLLAVLALLPLTARAHVTIAPRESVAGGFEKYTLRIPTEGKVATTGVDLEAPEGVIIESLQAPIGWKYEVTRKDDRIVSVNWQVDVKPGEFVEISFVARNPRDKTEIVWGLRQRFADGTVSDWTKGPNGIRPSAVTKLNPAPPKPPAPASR